MSAHDRPDLPPDELPPLEFVPPDDLPPGSHAARSPAPVATGPREDAGHRILAGRAECVAAVREALALAADAGCRELWWCDSDYADWPIGDREVVELLERWAYAHRKLTVLAASFDDFPRRVPRWVTWRRQWAHVVECRRIEQLEPAQVPGLLLAPGVVTLRIFDRVHHRGSMSRTAADAIRARETLDAVLQHSVESFPATTLGL